METFDWLAVAGLEEDKEEWRRNAKQIMEQEKMRECTFKPNLVKPREVSGTRSVTSGDKFTELYNLARQQRPKTDKTSEEVEYEKNREECTFAPQCRRKQSVDKPMEKQMSVHELREVERMKRAREEKERVKRFTERGIVLQNE